MSILTIESGIDPFTDPPTGVGYTDIECGKLRVYNSDTINFQVYGSIDKKKGYVTADIVQITVPPPPLPPPVPPVIVDRPYYYLVGFATPTEVPVIYPSGATIPLNNGGTITSSNEVIINDVNGDGSEFEVVTPGTYHILLRVDTISNVAAGITLDGTIVPQSTTKIASEIDCVIQIPAGGLISYVNISNANLIVRATLSGRRLYSTVLFELYTTP